MSEESFSRRYGYAAANSEITIRDDAPEKIRSAILKIAEGEIELQPGTIRDILCTVLRKLPNSNNWSAYPNIWDECKSLIDDAPWYKVYDFVEAVYNQLSKSWGDNRIKKWEKLINEYFIEAGVGWRLTNGELESRGPEAFETSVDRAREELKAAKLPTAEQEIHEALRDLSRRPKPDLTGAIQHAMAALECTAREAVDDPRATLGEILKRYPGIIPKPLGESLTKLWGYASGVARHVREGQIPSRAEAELIVGVASSACTYLAMELKTK